MTRGKTICSVLKTIRKQVADANDIKYEPRECHHEGECRGTCPACEAEVRYLEHVRRWGSAISIALSISFRPERADIHLLVESALRTADSLFRTAERAGFLMVGLAVVLHDAEKCLLGREG